MATKVKILFYILQIKKYFYLCFMNTNNTQITEEAAKYLAIAQMSNLLRESTYLDYQHHEMNNTGPDKRVYRNSVFSSDEHETVKRAFLKLCQQI